MNPLKLSDTEPFGIGGRRECYVHPHDPSKCVKVLRTDIDRSSGVRRFRIIPANLRRKYDNNEDERRILMSLEKRIGVQIQKHIPLCYGYEVTDLGPGLVLDLYRDSDGKISRSLRELFFLGHHPDEFKTAFDEFIQFFLDNCIVNRNLLDHNIVASKQQNGDWGLFLIDGFGDSSWLPIEQWSKTTARRKIKRRAARAWTKFHTFYETRRNEKPVEYNAGNNKTYNLGILRKR